MKKRDALYILSIFVLSIISFLPWSRRIYLFGMALFGWLMVALMLISPAVVLLLFLIERDKNS